MTLEEDNDAAGFLGVSIKRNPETKDVTFKQLGLTDRIIKALSCDDLPGVDTPAEESFGQGQE